MLWIAFVLCTFGLIYSSYYNQLTLLTVVNCFRSLYLWVDLQHPRRFYVEVSGCELLSFFVPLGWFTAAVWDVRSTASCELLSFFVPLGWFTATILSSKVRRKLWIAFVLCTFGLIYSRPRNSGAIWRLWIAFVLCTFGLIYSLSAHNWSPYRVVNCFRSLYLWVDLQQLPNHYYQKWCCELLSFFVPLGWFTAGVTKSNKFISCELLSFFVPLGWFTADWFRHYNGQQLWIAFVLCTFGLIYSSFSAKQYGSEGYEL